MKRAPRGRFSRRGFLAAAAGARLASSQAPATVYVVPNFHPASCGWLTNFSKERVYCANSYFDHLDRVRDDANYAFALSEVNNVIAMMNFHPERAEELKRRVREGRVELVNAFFLESTINLSGGEALVRLGVEGLRWQERNFGVRPRLAWIIDVCGTHEQMAQISAGLGLEAMVYTRRNPTGKTIHWAESPDGTVVLALSPGHYSEFGQMMAARGPLGEKDLAALDEYFEQKRKITPAGAPILVLAGTGDYSLAPLRKENPTAFLNEWSAARPNVKIRFGTPGQFLDAIKKTRLELPTMRGGTAYDYYSFWIQNPRVKEWFRRCEHLLGTAEMAATAASMETKWRYPVDTLYQGWLQMFLNMDRNTLWGAAGGMVFEHDRSWDVRDRFEWVERNSRETLTEAAHAMLGKGDAAGIVNPLNWERRDPFFIEAGTPVPAGGKGHVEDGRTLYVPDLPGASFIGKARAAAPFPAYKPGLMTERILTKHFDVRIDRSTGALASLMLRATPKHAEWEALGGPSNVIVAERQVKSRGDPGDHMSLRADRTRAGSSSDGPVEISVWTGVATVVEVRGSLLGKPCRRRMWFHEDYPRIDFETELNDVPDKTVVVAEFPLGRDITEVRRGIPYGFSHGAWSKPNPDLPGWTQGITPAVRWSHYQMGEWGGLAILDRGLPGRELTGRTPLLFLLNSTEKYRGYANPWLSGAGKHALRYAVTAHSEPWAEARIPHMAWEFNSPPVVVPGCGERTSSWLIASSNVIVESMRREGGEIEVRLAECLGVEDTAELKLGLAFDTAWVTDMTGGDRRPLDRVTTIKIPIRAQQILTVRFRVAGKVPDPKPVLEWEGMAPEGKRAALREYSNDKGHPPPGN